MTPRFEDLVEGVEGAERDRLRRAHDALVAAGPAPELGDALREPPRVGARVIPFRRRAHLAFIVPAAAAAAAFAIGFWIGDSSDTFSESRTVAMRALTPGEDASAVISVGEEDAVGNRPLLLQVSGLPALPKGGWYELFLTRDGKKIAACGTFAVKPRGVTRVQMSVAYELEKFDGWVVAEYDPDTHETGPPLLATEEF